VEAAAAIYTGCAFHPRMEDYLVEDKLSSVENATSNPVLKALRVKPPLNYLILS
jgi:hypothetical protein